MKYYVTADIHGYFSELEEELVSLGFFDDKEPHKLIICGDLFDRGQEALKLQDFILDLISEDKVILIRGNHEDLAIKLLNGWHCGSYRDFSHHVNMTIDTVCQLTGFTVDDMDYNSEEVGRAFLNTPYIQKIIPEMIDYYETEHYIFTHGWIPCTAIEIGNYSKEYVFIPDWRNADEKMWNSARWINGMEAAHGGITESGKTIVCGHWHCSFGHSRYEHKGGEFEDNPDFTPYYADGIIALDAATPASHKVNCIVIED